MWRITMRRCLFALTVFAGVAATLAFNVQAQLPPVKTGPGTEGGVLDNGDRDAILRRASLFAVAFNKGDARAIASLWTDNGESRDAAGRTFVGRTMIEKVYNAFFKANPGEKIEVLVKSIRF